MIATRRNGRGMGDTVTASSTAVGPLGAWWCPLFGPAAPAMFQQCTAPLPGNPITPLTPPDTTDTTGGAFNLPSTFDWTPVLVIGGLGLVGLMLVGQILNPPYRGRRR